MNEQKGVKRKKKSFLHKTMKFYKKGIHGRGVRIDEETFEYFVHILKVINQNFETEDDKRAFVENVFEQLEGNEIEYSRNQVVSRIVDNLLPFASDERVRQFMEVFGENVRPVCTDPFASFVFQKLMSVVTRRFLDEESASTTATATASTAAEETRSKYKPWLVKTFSYVLNNVEEFVFDQYANHVMRTAIKCMAGDTQLRENESNFVVDDQDFRAILDNFASRLLKWPQLSKLPLQNLSSGLVQVLLESLSKSNSKLVKRLCRKFLGECYSRQENDGGDDDDDGAKAVVPAYFENEPCIRLLEAMLSVASAKTYAKINVKCFAKRIALLAQHKEANFAVQKLIKYCAEKEQFEAIFDELEGCFEEILDRGYSGVILNLCEACVRLKTKQSVFVRLWMDCLHCNEPKEAQSCVFKLTVFLKKRQQFDEEKHVNVHLHGSLLVQNLLKFNKPIKIINSLLEARSSCLVNIFGSPKGSRIADSFFQSQFVGEKSKDKFAKMFQGCYTSLATSKHGSRVFDTVWAASNVKNRIAIASELSENESKLYESPFGRPIIYKTSLAQFRHNRDDWVQAQNQGDKVKKLFAEIT
ncbi:nucleolar protein 9 [Planococcus citri]|uniref:nucleolar protein 9 n=1 Tax=Planococcus citri TaxID=170843 RepID=UPI0031F760CE